MTDLVADPARTAVADPHDRAFLGHPRGLGWLAASELWERFSYYGMQTLLVLYMVHWLLLPGHAGHVIGLDWLRRSIESYRGPLSQQALSSEIFGLYTSAVYLTPLLGGWIADRWLGRTSTVTIGALLMALGHFLMAFEATFLIALACLMLGVGAFKGNISSQVGELYAPDDPRRDKAFQIFLLAVQIAVIVSPALCSWLARDDHWDRGFGAAGVGMLVGLATYLGGRRWLPREGGAASPASAVAEAHPTLTARDWRTVGLLVALVPVLALTIVSNQQIFNVYLLWAEKSLDLRFFGFDIPVGWLVSLDSVISTATLVASVLLWRWWGRRRREPRELTKIILGTLLGACGALVLAAASTAVQASGHKVSLLWVVGAQLLNDFGFANVLPVGLALYSGAAPRGTAGILVGVYFLNLSAANKLVGWLGGLFEKMSATDFWMLHAAIVGGAAVALLAINLAVGRWLVPAHAAAPAREA